ncbi:VOC family protein [Haloarcula amylovorans]|uniref:VOC family protein n=1 Tax=Haloarcula amylovorans TaxID=2562280 RepID=UPI00107609C2|nr:VOC family protein [Halomicroarcula amylolytica]
MSQQPDAAELPTSSDLPDSPIHTTGTDHLTIVGSNAEDTIAYYRDLLGMPLVMRQPNLDDPDSTHLFFDAGDGRILTFFVGDRTSDPRPVQPTVGGVHHISVSVDPEKFREMREALTEAGRQFSEFDRGIFHSVYTRDHNGLLVELAADRYDIPDDRRGEVMAIAQRLREEDGADYAKDEHVEAALEELGLPAEAYDLPDADGGAGGLR